MLGPAERADVIVDFSGSAGENILLQNDGANVMQFRVGKDIAIGVSTSAAPNTSALPSALRTVPRTLDSAAIRTRVLTLGEIDDPAQRPLTMLLNNAHWSMPITENPVLDSTEIWSFLNLTDDAHPIHLHLVRFQILDRQSFDPVVYRRTGNVHFGGPRIPADASEAGWKDTVRADPAMVTRIIIKFEGYAGRYVWHCHILEHEDNEMMRPYDVIAAQ
jgi:spore coat protein A